MAVSTSLKSRSDLTAALRRSFIQGVSWPLDRAGLTALVDLGLTNAQIASYFGVGADDVDMLRETFGER